MSYDNLRIGRHSIAGQVYLVTTVTAGRAPLFLDFGIARCVIAEMRHAHATSRVNSLAWVLMPDHLHWLFQLEDAGTLAQVMQSFKGRSARAVNMLADHQRSVWQQGSRDHHGRICQDDPLYRQRSIWQHSFHDRALRKEEDVRGVARYLAANPQRAGLVTQLGDYAHWDAVWL